MLRVVSTYFQIEFSLFKRRTLTRALICVAQVLQSVLFIFRLIVLAHYTHKKCDIRAQVVDIIESWEREIKK